MNRENREEQARRDAAPGGQPEREPGESLDAYRQRLRAFGEAYAQQRNERRRAYEQSEAAQQRGIAERGSPLLPRATPVAASMADGLGAKERLSPGDMALRQQPVNAQPPGQTLSAPAKVKPTLAAAKPPVGSGIGLADQAPGASPNPQEDALFASAEFQRMKQLAGAQNPYGGPQESREDYIRRMTEGIRSQLPGGKMPYETSEARLKEIEGRRAKEDTEYAESNKGRQLDNLLTMISGMGRGSFGNAGAQGIEAVQKVERSQREEDLRRKDMRDQQNMKLMEIRSLNDQAQMALAQGNVQAYEKLTQEAKKLKIDFDTTQASLNKDVATLGSTARARDTESADKAAQRRSQEKIASMGQSARAGAGEGKQQLAELKALQTSLKGQLDIAQKTFNKAEISKINADLAKVNAAIAKMAGLDTMSTAPGAGSPGGTRPPLSSFQR